MGCVVVRTGLGNKRVSEQDQKWEVNFIWEKSKPDGRNNQSNAPKLPPSAWHNEELQGSQCHCSRDGSERSWDAGSHGPL